MTDCLESSSAPRSLDDLVRLAQDRGPCRLVIAAAEDVSALRAARRAAEEGLIVPILVGSIDRIKAAAEKANVPVDDYEIVDTINDASAAGTAVRMVHDGAADLLMKGALQTRTILRAVLSREFGLRSSGLLSHVAVFESADDRRLILLTDPGVNARPKFTRKVEIVRNAVDVARKLGFARPKVAALAAVEKLNLPTMSATLDAEMLRRLGEAGEFGECDFAGPISLDVALSPDRSACKGIEGNPVAGAADILVAPEIETANTLYKAITCIAHKQLAGAVVGAKAPIVVPSRADSVQSKHYGIAFAAFLTVR